MIGENAVHKNAGAGGSSQVTAKYEVTPLEGIKKSVGNNTKVTFAQGYRIDKQNTSDEQLIKEAVSVAKNSAVAILVGGWTHGYSDAWNDNAFDAEGIDKTTMMLPFGQDELFEAVLNANPNTIVVLFGGGAIDMTRWASKAKAIVYAGYPGMDGGTALAKILFGDTNPSGKLPFTFPVKMEDVPAHKLGEYPGNGTTVTYKDDIFVGYRYFDTYNVTPAFPFGHGLSYTNFSISNVHASKDRDTVKLQLEVTNIGKVAGAEVVQVYVNDPETSITRPEKELKAFEKVFLQPGETRRINIALGRKAFQYYDSKTQSWTLEEGKFKLQIGNSSRNILATTTVTW